MSSNAFFHRLFGPSSISFKGPHHNTLFVFIVIAMACSACSDNSSGGSEKSSSCVSSVNIISTSPSTDVPLHVGERVKLKVDVGYVLSDETGSVNVVVEAADNSHVVEKSQHITKGKGQKTLEMEFVVPETKTIQVFTPVIGTDKKSTPAVDMSAFNVVQK